MSKIFNIAWKDMRVTFRDPGALIMMLATPFVLTLVMAFAFGGGGGSNVLQHVPLVVVNHDQGSMGASLVDTLQSPGLDDLLDPTDMADDTAARAKVDSGDVSAAVIIPSDFTAKITSAGAPGAAGSQQTSVEVYTNPARQVSAEVVRSVVGSVVSEFAAGMVGGQVAVTRLIQSGLLTQQEAAARGQEIGGRAALQTSHEQLVTVSSQIGGADNGSSKVGFDWLAYMAPSMAIMFLMFTVTAGGRTILSEREAGTLPRMLVTPTGSQQVVSGKIVGIFVVGLVQMGILILSGVLLFRLNWGEALPVALLTLALVLAATGWGMLLAAICRTPAQAGQFGAILSLVFAILAGNLVPRQVMPEWLRNASYITPNAWGLEGYTKLSAGGSLADVTVILAALAVMAVVLFIGATAMFRRQYA